MERRTTQGPGSADRWRAITLVLASLAACGQPAATGDGGGSDVRATDGALHGDTGLTGPDGGVTHDDGGAGNTDTGTPTDAALPPVTVSTWMGTNVSGDLPLVDITRYMAAFDTAAAQKDANGYPVAGASGTSSTDLGFQLPTGHYNISYTGDGTVAVAGIGALMGAFTTAGSEHHGVVAITGTPGAFGQNLRVTITNGSGAPVQNLRILMPGYDYATTQVFTTQFLALLAPFRALRTMDWQATNNSTLANWADRPRASVFGAQTGMPYEYLYELANQTGKDLWITIPEHASDDFIAQFAHFMRTGLDFTAIAAARRAQGSTAPFQLMMEYANETWNSGFSANHTFQAAADANASRYDGHYTGTYGPSWMSGNVELMRVGQYEGDGLVRIGNAFRTEFAMAGMQSAIAPVLSGWALGSVYSDVALQFIASHNSGPVSNYVSYVALAPYFGPDDAQTGSLASLFTSMGTNITSMDSVFQDFARLATADGIHVAAYEGGQGITGNTNLMVKHLAQFDQRMYAAYQSFFALWRMRFGDALFMHFTLAGTAGTPEFIYQYGFWGSLPGVGEDIATCGMGLRMLTGSESIASVSNACPKYQALREHVPN